ncbi:PASTA domain-containing protein [Streptomyces sp. NPDC059852]|uniref:PASTA domain-containing protein n=1 Tax=Streptomyces sp. NPDC059852 TaxID=3346972 RepID=UPI003668EDEA
MRTHVITAALLCAALGAVTACGPDAGTSSGATPTTAPPTTAAPATSEPVRDDKPTAAEKATVPDFVGMGLQSAQDKAQELGFFGLDSHDALGRDRMQAFDRNWKVCNQNVKAGISAATDTRLDFGAVKLDETCPAKEEKAPSAAEGKMPDFRGKSVKAARSALDSGTSITVDDASGDGRWVLVESNWQVCTQSPRAGTAVEGRPVTLTAVKFGESCP